jgi:hypothetical protein
MPVRLARSPAPELIVTMRPKRAAFMAGARACARKKALSTLTAKIARQSSSGTSSTGRPTCPRTPPAEETRIAGGRGQRRHQRRHILAPAEVGRDMRQAEVGGRRVQLRAGAVGDRHLAPSSASLRAMARPMPPTTPVTSAARLPAR